jgi:hypothetical protein
MSKETSPVTQRVRLGEPVGGYATKKGSSILYAEELERAEGVLATLGSSY